MADQSCCDGNNDQVSARGLIRLARGLGFGYLVASTDQPRAFTRHELHG
jgi:hypothetical protein